jgi:pimeloyl-ACP methyl ester carboxylesterase
MSGAPQYHDFAGEDGKIRRLAYRHDAGDPARPAFLWLSGFNSHMGGEKAEAVAAFARAHGAEVLRFDYSSHGASDAGPGTISAWIAEAEAMLAKLGRSAVLIGSSMGGWIALILACRAPKKVAALALIAPAWNMTEDLMWTRFPDEVRRQIMETGAWLAPSQYEAGGYEITRALIEDGRAHTLDPAALTLRCPVRILHGMEDMDVPYERTLRLGEALGGDVRLTLIRDAAHRLSRPQDLAALRAMLSEFV